MNLKRLAPIVVLLLVAVYLALFYHTRLPDVEQQTGTLFRRWTFFCYLIEPELLLQRWFGNPPQFAFADRLGLLAIAGGILALAASTGGLLLTLAGADRWLTRLERFVFSTAVGLNAISSYVLAVGWIGWLRNPWAFIVPGAVVLAAAGALGRRRVPPVAAADPPPPETGPYRLGAGWLGLAVVFAVILILGALLPPTDFDVREYHLQAPKEFFQLGRIVPLPHNVYANMPLGTEMLSLLAMVAAGDWWRGALAGKTLIAAMTLLTALGLWAAATRFFSRSAAVAAVVIYLSIPWIAHVSVSGLVEGASACYLFLAVFAAILSKQASILSKSSPISGKRPADRRRALPLAVLAGYLAGAAAACKYPALLFVVLPLALAILAAHGVPRWTTAGKPLVVFLLAVAAGCGLWLAKNWAGTGNPVYPLCYGVFDGQNWTPEKDRQWNHVHRPRDFSPARLAADLQRLALDSPWLSPLVWPWAVLALAVGRQRRLVAVLFLYLALVITLWWCLTHRIDRFWVPLLPVAALLAGVGVTWSDARPWRWGVVTLLVLVSLYGFLVDTSAAALDSNRYFLPLEVLRHDPERVDPWHLYFNARITAGKLLVVGDAQVFDLEMPVLYNTCFDDCIFQRLVAGRHGESVRRALAGLDIRYVFVHWGEIRRYRRRGNYGFTDFVQPQVFDRLVAEGVLEPLPPIPGHPGAGYRVRQSGAQGE
jgi:hypothetical protein